MTPFDFIPIQLLMNPAGMVKVTIEYHRLQAAKFFGESACVLG
jgi:hypothetical protein